MASKDTMTWNKFRALHKGISTNKLSQFWTDYKVGAYKLPKDIKSVTEEVVEQKAAKMEKAVVAVKTESKGSNDEEIIEMLQEYNTINNRVSRFGESMGAKDKAKLVDRAAEIAKLTAPSNYQCTRTDGWKLWTGPSSACILVNETRRIAFACNRGWWNRTWQGAKYVSYETVGTDDTLNGIRLGFIKNKKFVRRSPLEGVEIMLPRSARDTMLRGN